jgi:hypothetical protein
MQGMCAYPYAPPNKSGDGLALAAAVAILASSNQHQLHSPASRGAFFVRA